MNSDKAAEVLADIFRDTILLSHSLPLEITIKSNPLLAKVCWKYLCYREALLWRSEELAKAARNELLENRLVSSALLGRALLECAGGFYYLTKQLSAALKERNKSRLDETAMRLLLGSRWEDWEHQPINVLKLIDHMDREHTGTRKLYDFLSEFAHPNWSGTARSFSKHDRTRMVTQFGAYVGDNGSLFETCSISIATALPIILNSYNECSDIFPDFNRFCLEAFEKGASK